MIPNWLNPVPIVREYIAKKRSYSTKRVFKKKDLQQKVKDIQYTNLNSLKDGRINCGYDDDGRLLANSVSPYSKDFIHAIEPEIINLVLALLSKNYLTLSSCQAHCLYSKRYVTLVLNSQNKVQKLIKIISNRIPDIKYRVALPEKYMNMEMTFSDTEVFKGLKHAEDVSKDAAISSLNNMFCRSCDEYYILELRLSEEITDQDTWWSSFKKKMYKIFKMKYVTHKLEKLIKSDDFPVYMG